MLFSFAILEIKATSAEPIGHRYRDMILIKRKINDQVSERSPRHTLYIELYNYFFMQIIFGVKYF